MFYFTVVLNDCFSGFVPDLTCESPQLVQAGDSHCFCFFHYVFVHVKHLQISHLLACKLYFYGNFEVSKNEVTQQKNLLS